MDEQPCHGVYDLETGKLELVPMSDDELAEYDARGAAIAEAAAATPPALERATFAPDGIVGWTCRQVIGAVCMHAECQPASVVELAPQPIDAPAPKPVELPTAPLGSLLP